MFLGELKPEQKELFLDIGISLAGSDGDFSPPEKKMICDMCKEMGIAERITANMDFKEAIHKIKEKITTREKRIILLEIAGIVMADDEFSEDEVVEVKKITKEFDISYEQFEEIVEIVKELLCVYSKIGSFLTRK